MKPTIQRAFSFLAIMFSMTALGSARTSDPLPSADHVVGKMMQLDAQRQSELTGYTALKRYLAVNKKRRAKMFADCRV